MWDERFLPNLAYSNKSSVTVDITIMEDICELASKFLTFLSV